MVIAASAATAASIDAAQRVEIFDQRRQLFAHWQRAEVSALEAQHQLAVRRMRKDVHGYGLGGQENSARAVLVAWSAQVGEVFDHDLWVGRHVHQPFHVLHLSKLVYDFLV